MPCLIEICSVFWKVILTEQQQHDPAIMHLFNAYCAKERIRTICKHCNCMNGFTGSSFHLLPEF